MHPMNSKVVLAKKDSDQQNKMSCTNPLLGTQICSHVNTGTKSKISLTKTAKLVTLQRKETVKEDVLKTISTNKKASSISASIAKFEQNVNGTVPKLSWKSYIKSNTRENKDGQSDQTLPMETTFRANYNLKNDKKENASNNAVPSKRSILTKNKDTTKLNLFNFIDNTKIKTSSKKKGHVNKTKNDGPAKTVKLTVRKNTDINNVLQENLHFGTMPLNFHDKKIIIKTKDDASNTTHNYPPSLFQNTLGITSPSAIIAMQLPPYFKNYSFALYSSLNIDFYSKEIKILMNQKLNSDLLSSLVRSPTKDSAYKLHPNNYHVLIMNCIPTTGKTKVNIWLQTFGFGLFSCLY